MSGCSSEDEDEVSDCPLPAWMEGDSLAPPCQADMDVVKAIIDFAGVTSDDVVYDLGCGDGRICIEAAESRGARACGVEIEKNLVNKFRRRVAAKGLESKVKVIHGDLRQVDLSNATVVVTYLLPQAMNELAKSHLLPLLRKGGGLESDCKVSTPRGCTQLGTRVNGTLEQALALDSNGTSPSPAHEDMIEGATGTSNAREGAHGTSDAGSPRVCSTRREKATSTSVPTVGAATHFANITEDKTKGKGCRIVCNTWGIPGAVPVKEAGVGMYEGVKLRLFTSASLPGGMKNILHS